MTYRRVLHAVLRRRELSLITVRVSKEVKRRLERSGVNVSETVRAFLERYVADIDTKETADRLETLKERVAGRIDGKLVARLVREDREAR